MTTSFYKGVVLGAVASTIVLAGAAALAATGGNFILGQSNTATFTSGLSASLAASSALDVSNPGGGPAASFESSTAASPFTVNSKKKVVNLNADMVGGKRASAFLPVAGTAADSDKLDGLDSTAFQPFLTGSSGGASVSFGDFVGVGGESANDDNVAQVVPVSRTLNHLYVHLWPVANQDQGFTIVISGLPSTPDSLTCTVPAGSASCSDTIHTTSIVPGDRVRLYYNIGGAAPFPTPSVTWSVGT